MRRGAAQNSRARGAPEIFTRDLLPRWLILHAAVVHAACVGYAFFFVPATSFVVVILCCAWNISVPPPAAGVGRRGFGAAAAGWGAGRVVVLFQYALVSLCSNTKWVSFA